MPKRSWNPSDPDNQYSPDAPDPYAPKPVPSAGDSGAYGDDCPGCDGSCGNGSAH